MEKRYQCCYTNAVSQIGETVSSEWRIVKNSKNIPMDALKSCSALQNLNSPDCANMIDEEGKILNQYDLITDRKYVYIMRTQYGLVDRVGRPNMFSHAFIIPFDGTNVLEDPNLFLKISNGNFIKDESEFQNETEENTFFKEDTEIPSNMDEAMSEFSGDWGYYQKFIKCLYYQLDQKKVKSPLYVLYEGSDDEDANRSMKRLMYLAYSGIPFHLRKKIRFASSAMGGKKSEKQLVFVKKIPNNSLYFNPKTGENNLLTSSIEKRIENLGYITYPFLENKYKNNVSKFFKELNEKVLLLSNSDTTNKLLLKIAFQMLQEDNVNHLSDEKLVDLLNDCLYSLSDSSVEMERFILKLLREINQREIIPNDNMIKELFTKGEYIKSADLCLEAKECISHLSDRHLIELLDDYLSSYSTTSDAMINYLENILQKILEKKIKLPRETLEDLINTWPHLESSNLLSAVEECIFQAINDLKIDVALEVLDHLTFDLFKKYEEKQYNSGKNNSELLKQYYTGKINEIITINDLKEYYCNRIKYLYETMFDNVVVENAVKIVQTAMQGKGNVGNTYEEFCEFLKLNIKDPYKIEEAKREVKQYFWDESQLDRYFDEKSTLAEKFKDDSHEKCRLWFELHELEQLINKVNVQSYPKHLFETTFHFFSHCKMVDIPLDEKEKVKGKLYTTILKDIDYLTAEFFEIIYEIVNENGNENKKNNFVYEIIKIMEEVQKKDYEKLQTLYYLFQRNWKEDRSHNNPVYKKLGECLIKKCLSFDVDETVPLDLWLILGLGTKENPFMVLDEYHPNILSVDAKEVVNGSNELHKEDIKGFALKYIEKKDKKTSFKIVKKWMDEVKKMQNQGTSDDNGKRSKIFPIKDIFKRK